MSWSFILGLEAKIVESADADEGKIETFNDRDGRDGLCRYRL